MVLTGLSLNNSVELWIDEISRLIDPPDALQALYQGSVTNFHQLNSHQEQKRFWQQHFVGVV